MKCQNHDALHNLWLERFEKQFICMNQGGKNQVGSSLVSRRSVQSYILTYSRPRNYEPLIALGSEKSVP